MRILVAEDEKDLNRLLSTRLKAEHYSVDSCFDGQEALDYLEGAPYDAVVLDIMMPVLDGLSVLKDDETKGESDSGLAFDGEGQCGGSCPRAGVRERMIIW